MALFDLLGRTWAMGVVWQLGKGPATFRELQGRCEQISPSLLNTRLKELRASKIIDLGDDGYELTKLGQGLFAQLKSMNKWSESWASEITDAD